MPHSFTQWFWLLFFGGGALGGWLLFILLAIDFARGFVRGWKRERAK